MQRARRIILVVTLVLLCANSLFAQKSSDGGLRIEVTNAAGQPLGRACVTVVPREGEIAFRQCNRHGKANFKGLAPGSYRVVVKVDGYEAQKREVTVNANTETAVFSLQPRKL
jgi:hypothetical protein